MEPILNSAIKEEIRVRCEKNMVNQVKLAESDRNTALARCSSVWSWGLVACAALGFLLANVLGQAAFAIAGILMVVCLVMRTVMRRRIKKNSAEEIEKMRSSWEAQTRQEIGAYEAQLKQYCQKALKNSASIRPMADYVTDMFQRNIRQADSGPNVKYIEAELTYEVRRDGIYFSYEGDFFNALSEYNFDRQRFRNLTSDVECVGLSRALAIMTTKDLIDSYPPHYVVGDKIPLTHRDAMVTLHFKAVNPNFRTAKDIF